MMMWSSRRYPSHSPSAILLGLACLLISIGVVEGKPPMPIPRGTEHRDVRYLPDWRYSGDPAPQRDGQMVMDIVVPEDGKDAPSGGHPVLLVVHGGGWFAGSKDERKQREIMAYFVQRGYVTVGFNYILRPRGIFPQVYWDYNAAVRFLREHADEYQIDPTKFGAIGLSAGGWLITSTGHASGDLLLKSGQHSAHIGEMWEHNWQLGGRTYEDTFLRPMIDPDPVNPNGYSRVQAISYDFDFRTRYGSGNSPATNQWEGEGYNARPDEQAALDSGRFDHSETVLTHPSYKGRQVHVPPLFESKQKDGSDKAEAIGIDGKAHVPAIERIDQFFQHELVDDPRTPMPEINPAWRLFDESTKVSFMMPMEGGEIRYQVLPLEKQKGKRWNQVQPAVKGEAWREWQKYDGPFEVTRDSLVRAVATSEGRRPSTVAEAHFFKGVKVPSVTAPEGRDLPQAKTGERYTARFESDAGDKARWFLAGDLVPYSERKEADYVYPNGMIFDTKTGAWAGVPTRPGKYWIQVWVNDAAGAPARHRDYTWTVTGDDLSKEPEAVAEVTDPNVELLYLTDPRHPHHPHHPPPSAARRRATCSTNTASQP